jgi:hypothetical protein
MAIFNGLLLYDAVIYAWQGKVDQRFCVCGDSIGRSLEKRYLL